MIDIHSHILPEIDDGPDSINESIEMCLMALSDGIDTIVATPHINPGLYNHSKKLIIEKISELKDRIGDKGLNLSILPGADIRIDPGLLDDIRDTIFLTVNDNNRYIMIELPFDIIPHGTDSILNSLFSRGIIPIISHPERNIQIQNDFSILRSWKRRGILFQVTAMSITGGFGIEVERCVKRWLKDDLIDIIATDAHSTDKRPPILSHALKIAGEIIGEEKAYQMVTTFPESVTG
ncbi:MAG: tyrosine-protein phosphatase [Nitrospirota bacterium]